MASRRRWRELARSQTRLASTLTFHDEAPSHKERTDPLRSVDEFRSFLRALSEADDAERLGKRSRRRSG